MERHLKIPQKKQLLKLQFLKIVILFSIIAGGCFFYQDDISKFYSKYIKNQSEFLGLTIQNIKVQGYARTSDQDIYHALGVKIGDPLSWINMDHIYTRLKVLPWIADAVLERKWPNRLIIHLTEKIPMVRWQKDYKLHLIDGNGQIIIGQNLDNFKHLPLVIGQGAPQAAQELLLTLEKVPTLKSFPIAYIRIGQRRWNIVLPGNKMILLPEGDQESTLMLLETLRTGQDIFSKFDKTLDMRIKDKIVLR